MTLVTGALTVLSGTSQTLGKVAFTIGSTLLSQIRKMIGSSNSSNNFLTNVTNTPSSRVSRTSRRDNNLVRAQTFSETNPLPLGESTNSLKQVKVTFKNQKIASVRQQLAEMRAPLQEIRGQIGKINQLRQQAATAPKQFAKTMVKKEIINLIEQKIRGNPTASIAELTNSTIRSLNKNQSNVRSVKMMRRFFGRLEKNAVPGKTAATTLQQLFTIAKNNPSSNNQSLSTAVDDLL